MKVSELIEKLREFDPNATVGVRASCCSHAHEIREIRARGTDDWTDEAEVIVDAN